jgi:4-hydroxyphenylpyruvate dioxygenase
MSSALNPLGLQGISFIEFSSSDPKKLHTLFTAFGFSRIAEKPGKNVSLYQQGEITFLLNQDPQSFGASFEQKHGPCVSSMGWKFLDVGHVVKSAPGRGCQMSKAGDYGNSQNEPIPALVGIGESLIYCVPHHSGPISPESLGFVRLKNPEMVPSKGFLLVDHLTNNVEQGTMAKWANFYKDVFGFTEVRYFDIRGAKTGLTSYALRSPCGNFCIPINEGTEAKSQINEYLREYKGPGVQHIAFLSENLIQSLEMLQGTGIETLDIDDAYYQEVFERLPNVTEDRAALRRLNILVDGDENGYLLQIFTKNVIGPIFIEMIQRKNNLSFGEGNFGALFRSLERDQEKRGVL